MCFGVFGFLANPATRNETVCQENFGDISSPLNELLVAYDVSK
jgi:hypothetical protein